MAFTVGVFEVFGSTIPGAMYLSLLLYVADRLGWLSVGTVYGDSPTAFVVGFLVVSYTIGTLMYGVARAISRRLARRSVPKEAVRVFLEMNPHAAGRPFLAADPFLLFARIEISNPDMAGEISRVRANGTMLRGLFLPFVLSSVVAVVELAVSDHRLEALAAAVLFAFGAAVAMVRSWEMSRWAYQKTLETSFWLDDVHDKLKDID